MSSMTSSKFTHSKQRTIRTPCYRTLPQHADPRWLHHSANLGVNPSLTITALSEYAMSLVPVKEGYVGKTLIEELAAKSQA